MVIGEGEVHHGTDYYLISNSDGALLDRVKNWFNNVPGALVKFHHNSYQHGKHRYCKYCLPSVMGIPTEEEQLKYVESLPDSDTE